MRLKYYLQRHLPALSSLESRDASFSGDNGIQFAPIEELADVGIRLAEEREGEIMISTVWATVHEGRIEPLEKITAPEGTQVLVTLLLEDADAKRIEQSLQGCGSDYEFQPNSSEAIIRLTAIGRMTHWLERHNT